jgi:hypothetical protein
MKVLPCLSSPSCPLIATQAPGRTLLGAEKVGFCGFRGSPSYSILRRDLRGLALAAAPAAFVAYVNAGHTGCRPGGTAGRRPSDGARIGTESAKNSFTHLVLLSRSLFLRVRQIRPTETPHVPNPTLFPRSVYSQYSKVPEFATNILSRPRPLMPNAPAAQGSQGYQVAERPTIRSHSRTPLRSTRA